MKTLKDVAVLAVLVLISGCRTAPPDVTTSYDPITGERTDLMSENVLETPQTPPREVVWLNADHIYKDAWNRGGKTYLEVNYMAKTETGYLEIPIGTTLLLNVDGQELNFSGNGSFNKRKPWKKGFVRETALYEVSRTQLAKIANAKQIKVKIKGNNGIVERDFAPDNFKRFQDFLARLRG